MTILVVGATGTLGRQIVRQATAMGYPVRCTVRNVRRAAFLREWGAELVYADLKSPETLPNALKGITVIIDAATLRPEEELSKLEEVDLVGKFALIKAAQLAGIKRYIFFSISNSASYPYIPLMNAKSRVEKALQSSGLPFTIFQLSGFYQGLIGQYAVSILDQQTVWTTKDASTIPYMDTQDVAKFCLKSLILEETVNKTYNLGGSKRWSSAEIISLCEKLSGLKAEVSFIPLILLSFLRQITAFSKWSWAITDRLSFVQVLSDTSSGITSSEEVYKTFKFSENDLLSLEDYLKEYFSNMLKRLRELNYDQELVNKRKDLTF